MGITSVTELPRRGGGVSEKNERTYSRLFQVTSTIPDESALVVAVAPGIVIGDPYVTSGGNDPYAKCVGVDVSQSSEDGYTWEATVNYGLLPEDETDDPKLQEPDVEWSYQQFERNIDRDADGKAIRNSANDPFQEAISRDDSRPVLSVSRNEATYNAVLAYQYRDAVNADVFGQAFNFTARPGTVKVTAINGKLQHDQFYGDYWRVTYVFTFDPAGFNAVVLDQGFRELDDDGELKNIVIDGVPISDPVLLDGKGKQLEEGEDAVFLDFQKYVELPFSVFNF